MEKLEEHVFKVFDPEDSGLIAFRRFMLVLISFSGGTPEENIEKMFYMVDLNNDGVLTSEVNIKLLASRYFIYAYVGIQICLI